MNIAIDGNINSKIIVYIFKKDSFFRINKESLVKFNKYTFKVFYLQKNNSQNIRD